ncbi:C4-dicarboxylate ABC transporter substrate-binding protein [Ammoniphilus oxalaticus]|uniref:C4-dicarboxylate ABC transporter substrate-binding protein n=2 Tax=Ammoniphilus oxalaticus TaxID=66863 RepID=A0A419SRR3_9BACL|nr:C4-dicarboxylate ABC transporter substrate-binding protein [Ammoniphilus oxalaticus]
MLVLTIVFSLFAVACGGGGNNAGQPSGETNDGAGEKLESLIIATGGSSGTYYPLGGSMAQLFQDHVIPASAQVTAASVANMRLLKDGEVDLAFTQGDIADYATKGTIMFEEGGAIDNIQAIASLYNETVQIIVPENSSIQTVADLKGKHVSVGEPGSGTEANAEQLLEVYGLTFDDLGKAERLSFGESTSHIQDGTVEAAFVTAGTPTAAVNELAATKGVRVIGLDDEHIAELIEKYPYYTEQAIAAGTYSGFDQDIKTVAVKAQLVVRAELDEALVYDLTKTLFDNLDAYKQGNHQKAEEITLEQALEGVSLDVHPGAAKYFEEKGIK